MNEMEALGAIDPKEFGRRLKALRLKLDLTLIEMGEPAGVSGDTIRELENGDRPRPHERTLYRLIKAYPKLGATHGES